LSDTKDRVTAAIARARADLTRLPAFDPNGAGVATHMLNNYATVMSATVDLLQLALAEHPDPQVQTWLHGLQHTTSLMTHAIARGGGQVSGEAQLRFEEVDLGMLVRRACGFYQRVADRKKIEIQYRQENDLPAVTTDRVALAAVMDNLLSNAVKYSSPGGRIEVRLERRGDAVVCSVEDHGAGLSREDQARLFQPGARLTPVPTGGEASTGYGLAVARELTEKLGGEIACASELGRGSCFSIRLPVRREGR
jgi:signal transduction histidine kinase